MHIICMVYYNIYYNDHIKYQILFIIYILSIYWYPDTSRWLHPTDSTPTVSSRVAKALHAAWRGENEPGENVENNGDFTGDFMGKMLVNDGKASRNGDLMGFN